MFKVNIFLMKREITGFILTGGKSNRMGIDKGLCYYKNTPFINWIYNELSSLCNEVYLIGSIKSYEKFNIKTINDIYHNQGPIGGIHTALTHSKTTLNIIVSCDIPLIKKDILGLLIINMKKHDVVQLATKKDEMPLIACYKKELAPFFLQKIKNKELRLRKALKEINVKTIKVSTEQEKLLKNINTPEQLKVINDESKS